MSWHFAKYHQKLRTVRLDILSLFNGLMNILNIMCHNISSTIKPTDPQHGSHFFSTFGALLANYYEFSYLNYFQSNIIIT